MCLTDLSTPPSSAFSGSWLLPSRRVSADTPRFRCRTPADIERLIIPIAALFPDPERVQLGIIELLLNAVEHGNLQIGYDKKTRLLEEGGWHDTIEQRLHLPQYAHKTVDVAVHRGADYHCLQVTDEGAGFNWRPYLTADPAHAAPVNGRGIALARQFSFDRLQYNRSGNQVRAYVYHRPARIY